MQTVFQSATKRFTTERSRSAGYSLWYLFMNIGAAAAGFLVDLVRKGLGLPNAHIFTAGVGFAIACSAVTFWMVRQESQLGAAGPSAGDSGSNPSEAEPRKNPIQIALAVIREPALWRLLALIALMLGVRAIFTYLGLSMVPWFLAKTVVSVISGHLLVRWCPEGIGPQMAAGQVGFWSSPPAMWLILAAYAFGGCALALLLRPWFTRGLKADEQARNARA